MKGEGSIYRPRAERNGGSRCQDDEMVREGQDSLKREHKDCVSLAPMREWQVSQKE